LRFIRKPKGELDRQLKTKITMNLDGFHKRQQGKWHGRIKNLVENLNQTVQFNFCDKRKLKMRVNDKN